MVEKLFIIGNGFDIAHDLKTNYLYFKKFVYQQAYGKDKLLESLQSESAIKLYIERLDYEILEDIDDYSIPEIHMAPDGGDLYPDDEELYKLLYQLMGQITETEKFWSVFEEKLADFDKISITTTDITDKDGDLDGSKMANNANDIGETLAKYILYSLNKLFKEWIEETYSEWAARILTKSEESLSKLFKSTILNNPDAILAIPSATNSIFDRCLLPIIPSDTTADNNDSIEHKNAIVNAGANKTWILAHVKWGIDGIGNEEDKFAYWLPIVCTSNFKTDTRNVVTTIAIKDPGIFLLILGQIIKIAKANEPIINGNNLALSNDSK